MHLVDQPIFRTRFEVFNTSATSLQTDHIDQRDEDTQHDYSHISDLRDSDIERGRIWQRVAEEYTSRHPFLDCSATYWAYHYKQGTYDPEQFSIKDLLVSGSARFETWYGIYRASNLLRPEFIPGFFASIVFELDTVLERLLKDGQHLDETDSDGFTALFYTTDSFYRTKLLLQHGANPSPECPLRPRAYLSQGEEKGKFSQSPFGSAPAYREHELADILLTHGCDINKHSGFLRLPYIFEYVSLGSAQEELSLIDGGLDRDNMPDEEYYKSLVF